MTLDSARGAPVRIFSFGTLRMPSVQLKLFGCRVPGSPDRIVGYRVGRVRITDPDSIAASGSDVHPALIATGDPTDEVEGEVLELSSDELATVDRYERASFVPIEVLTREGRAAIAYAPRPDRALED